MKSGASFSRLVSDAMARRGLGLRELCRRAELDPSFFSKVLAGKRSPPSEEEPLRRVARALELDPVEVIVAAGRIPTDWGALWSDSELVRAVHAVATGRRSAPRRAAPAPHAPRPPLVPRPPRPERYISPPPILPGRGLSEELL
jgi:transcriptional regulator with XRE-family HTH domain